MQGLRNAQANGLPWAQDIALTVGLFCDRVLSYGAIDYLVDKAGVPIDKALGFEYRSKRWRGWPGDVCVRTRGGEDRYLDKHYRSLCKEFFTLARCRLCFDKCNVFSDLTFGDAWGVRQAVEGFSVILARTPKGLDMLLSAEKAGALRLEKIAPEVVFKAQGAENRRRNWTAYTAVWQQMGRAAPDFGIASRWWASLDQVDLAPFRRHLERAMDLSSRASRDEVVNVAKRNLFLPGILWLFRKVCRKLSPRRVAWAVWRRARRILAK
jgi:coenzyme F420 hydrogenase subunit beta